jgi:putative tricarboxylic transport membrane protein
MANWLTLGFSVVMAAVYLYATTLFPALHLSDPLGPQAFPRLLGIGVLLTCVALLIETLRERALAEKSAAPVASESTHYGVVIGTTVWTALYFAVFEWLGYAVSTSLYLLVLMAWFRRDRWVSNALTAVMFSFGSYLMFTRLLLVTLPQGFLPF